MSRGESESAKRSSQWERRSTTIEEPLKGEREILGSKSRCSAFFPNQLGNRYQTPPYSPSDSHTPRNRRRSRSTGRTSKICRPCRHRHPSSCHAPRRSRSSLKLLPRPPRARSQSTTARDPWPTLRWSHSSRGYQRLRRRRSRRGGSTSCSARPASRRTSSAEAVRQERRGGTDATILVARSGTRS